MNKFFRKHFYLVIFMVVFSMAASWFFLIAEGEYGVTLFFTIPISIGFIIGYLRYFRKIGVKKIFKVALRIILGLFIFSIVLFACGIEGAICIAMAIPFIAFAVFVGYVTGSVLGSLDEERYTGSVLLFVLLINPASYIFDTYAEPIEETVITERVIDASSDKVWKLLSTEIVFDKPSLVLFEKGGSYPQSIKLVDENGRLVYRCQTNNDKVNLNIDEYVENQRVRFSLEKQTVPMKEISPYEEMDAKHLHDYFVVEYGEISLQRLSENKTKITAKTQYNYRIAPKWYWKKWSNYIVDKMQGQVLGSIKTQAEDERATAVF